MDYSVIYPTVLVLCAAAGITVYFNKKFGKRLNKNLSDAEKVIGRIIDGTYEPSGLFFSDAEYKNLYQALDKLWEDRTSDEKKHNNLIDTTSALTNNIEMQQMLSELMPRIVKFTDSTLGVFYLLNKASGKLELKYSVGFTKNIYEEFDITIGDGLIGGAAKTGETQVITDIPDDTVFITKTFLGKIIPKNIIVAPVSNNDGVLGVLGLASIKEYIKENIDEINFLKKYMAMAVSNSLIYENSKRLAGELKFQNRLIADLNEELEKNMNDRTKLLDTIMEKTGICGIYALDLKGTITSWNSECTKIYGIEKKAAIGTGIYKLCPKMDTAENIMDYRIGCALKNGVYREEKPKTLKNGNIVYLREEMFSVCDATGEATGIACTVKDVTALKTAKDALFLERRISEEIASHNNGIFVLTDESLSIIKVYGTAKGKSDEIFTEGVCLANVFTDSGEVLSFIEGGFDEDKTLPVVISKTNIPYILKPVYVRGSGPGIRRLLIYLEKV